MEFTGERVIPGQVDRDLWNEHLARYAFAARLLLKGTGPPEPLRVLDAGCGAGYGAALLACVGPGIEVVGVDQSEEALEYARAHYCAPNLRFERADCLALEFDYGAFDLVVAFEVIEHLAEADAFLRQARRVLSPAGRLLVSTPNRRYYSEERGYANPFHTREYDAAELDALLAPLFPERVIFVQNHAAAVAFYPCGSPAQPGRSATGVHGAGPVDGAFGAAPAPGDQPHFLLALASAGKLTASEPFVFVPSAGNLLREREQHIRKLEQDFQRNLEERKRWAEKLEEEVAERDRTIRGLQAEHEGTVAWAKGLEAELEEARRVIEARLRELDERTAWARELDAERQRLAGIIQELQADLERKVAWAHSLEADVEKARAELARLQREFDERTQWALQLSAELEAARAELATLWHRFGKALGLV